MTPTPSYASLFAGVLAGTPSAFLAFFLTGNVYLLGTAALLTYLTIALPVFMSWNSNIRGE